MRQKLTLALATTFLAALGAAQTPDEFKAFIKAENAKSVKAFEAKDLKYFESISSPDFVYTDASGAKQNKKQSMAGMRSMFEQALAIKSSVKEVAIKLTGSVGTVELESSYTITLKPGPDGRKHVMSVTAYTRETWRRVGSRWKVAAILETKPAKLLIDGKPAPPPGPGSAR